MAIRIRIVDGHFVAVCAARSKLRAGDFYYLCDAADRALRAKFLLDYESEGLLKSDTRDLVSEEERNRIRAEETEEEEIDA